MYASMKGVGARNGGEPRFEREKLNAGQAASAVSLKPEGKAELTQERQ